jgi:hypothetical protein
MEKIIHLVRDARNTAYSLAENELDKRLRGHKHRAHYHAGEKLPPAYEVVEEEVEKWEDRVRRSREAFENSLEGKEVLTVRYEDLTENRSTHLLTGQKAREILDFLGVEYRDLSTGLVKSGSARRP